MKKDLPIFEMKIKDDSDGVFNISLVDTPANEYAWVVLKEDKELILMSSDEERKTVTGVVLSPEQLIYRNSSFSQGECYIKYDKSTIRQCAELFLTDDKRGGATLMHKIPTEDALIVESWVTESETQDKIATILSADVPAGSWCVTYKIFNDDIWESVKDGTFAGFSIEGSFSTVEVEQQSEDEFFSDEDVKSFFEHVYNKLGL